LNSIKDQPAHSREFRGDELIELGVVGRPFGLRGEVRLRLYNLESETLFKVDQIFLRAAEGQESAYTLKNVRWHQGGLVATLKGCMTRDDAERLRGLKVLVRKDDLPELEGDEYYWYQIIGLEVWCKDECVGRISRILSTAPELDGNDVLVVESDLGEIMIPAVREVVREVNFDSGRMIIEPGKGYDPQV
jgi:16S rRNA processing protein RimM